MGDKYQVADLANATGQDLMEFISQNSRVIAEVKQHLENLEKLGGTSKAHAMGYQFYLEDSVNIEDFTNHLSKKGYDISMESLSTVLLVAASAAIVAGVGYLAYKMIKASLNKNSKTATIATRLKEVEKITAIMANVDVSTLSEEFKQNFLARVNDDVIPAAKANMSDADILHGAFSAYLRNEMASKSVSNYTLGMMGKTEGDYLFHGASQYVSALKPVLEAFRVEFLDVVSEHPELFKTGDSASGGFKSSPLASSIHKAAVTDNRVDLMQIAGENGWRRHEVMLEPAIARIRQWAKTHGVLPSEQAQVSEILDAAMSTLFVPAGDDKLRKFSSQIGVFPSTPSPRDYEQFRSSFAEFKRLGEKLKASGERFRRHGKIPGDIASIFEIQIRHATELFDTAERLENGIRREADAVDRFTAATAAAAKANYQALMAAAEKLTDPQEREKAIYEIKDTARAAAELLRKMATESYMDDRLHLGEVMALEGRSVALDFLKTIGIVVILGLAAGIIYSGLMSLMGIASFSAAWKGGLVWFDKSGKKITGAEAGKLIADKAAEKKLGQFGVEAIVSGGNPPIRITNQLLNSFYGEVERGIKDSLAAFDSKIETSGSTERLSDAMIMASEAGINKALLCTDRLANIMNSFGIKVKDLKPTNPDAIAELRERVAEFEDKWFNPDKASYDRIKRGDFNQGLLSSFSEDAPEVVDRHVANIGADLKRFGSKVRTVDRDTFAGLSDEARANHEEFINAIGFVSAMMATTSNIVKSGMRQVNMGLSCMRESLKMRGESFDSSVDDAVGEEIPDYIDPVPATIEQAAEMTSLSADDQAVMVQENWGQVAKTGLIIVGALALLGAGAMILKSMMNRPTPPKTTPEQFFKVNAGAHMSTAFDNLADDIRRMQEQFQQAAKKASQQPPKATRVDGRNQASGVPPEHKKSAEEELVDVSSVYKQIESEIRERPYTKRLTENLTTRKAGRILWGIVMKGPKESFEMVSSMTNEEELKETFALLEGAIEDIVHPIFRITKAGDPNAEAERVYDQVVEAMEKFSSSKIATEAAERTAALVAFRESVMEFPGDDEQKSIREMFNPDGMKNADINYQPMYKACVVALDNLREVVELAERRDGMGMPVDLDKLRGNRDKASSLLRRSDEFKPIFSAVTRLAREMHTTADLFTSNVLEGLRIHRKVQKDYAVMVQKLGLATASARIALEESGDAVAEFKDAVKKMTDEQSEISRLLKEAGL